MRPAGAFRPNAVSAMQLLRDTFTLEIQRCPFILRTLTGIARMQAPIFEFQGAVFVVNEQGVHEVFSRPADFLFGFGHGHQMKLGPFLFGMDASAQYFAEKEALQTAALGTQLERMQRLVREEALRLLPMLPTNTRRMDIFSDFIEPALLRAIAQFYGVCACHAKPSAYLSAPSAEKTFAQWIRKLGAVIGSSVPAPFGLEELSNGLATEMSAFLVGEIERGAPTESVIGKLKQGSALRRPHDIARCVGGLMLAGAAVLKAAIHSLHELLARRPDGLDAAVHSREDEPEERTGWVRLALLGYAWEALRFRPTFPLLPRYCPRDTVLGAGRPYERNVRADQTVIVSPLAAMFDPLHVERPEEFIPTRPPNTYYHFGLGLHRCFGERLAMVMIPELFSVLLANIEIEGSGWITYEGPAVARYVVKCRARAQRCEIPHEPEHPDNPRPVADPPQAA